MHEESHFTNIVLFLLKRETRHLGLGKWFISELTKDLHDIHLSGFECMWDWTDLIVLPRLAPATLDPVIKGRARSEQRTQKEFKALPKNGQCASICFN